MRTSHVLLLACVALTAPGGARAANDYSDSEYLQHDLDNYFRARGRQITESISAEYHQDFAGACADETAKAAGRQANDARFGRVSVTVGAATCWWSVGDAPRYFDVGQRRVFFLSRTGAKLQGHIWGTEAPGPRPGVVITTGSIQATDQMYWWAARALAAAGYVVMTWDVQGQGGSETFSHEPGSPTPGLDGVPSQQAFNFHEGTIDALRFFLSTAADPYLPEGWTPADVAAANAAASGEQVDWTNPGWGALDRSRIGIAGHSLGAGAVSNVQQCSSRGTVWQTVPVCGGRSYPILAVVAWDALSGDETITPVVPAMSQQADGYFLFPTLSPTAPAAASSLGGFGRWDGAGVDVFVYVVRGGTHIEWSQVPYTSATTYGAAMNAYYTVAWMDRWLSGDASVRQAAYEALTAGPASAPSNPWSANHFSARRLSAFRLHAPATETGPPALRAVDLRAWAGRSAVGDWAGANADREGRVLP